MLLGYPLSEIVWLVVWIVAGGIVTGVLARLLGRNIAYGPQGGGEESGVPHGQVVPSVKPAEPLAGKLSQTPLIRTLPVEPEVTVSPPR